MVWSSSVTGVARNSQWGIEGLGAEPPGPLKARGSGGQNPQL